MGIIISLIAFPLVVALVLLFIGGDKARGFFISLAALLMTAGSMAVSVIYFRSGKLSFSLDSWFIEYIVMAVVALLSICVIYICVKNGRYLPAVLIIIQAAAFVTFGMIEGYAIDVQNDIHVDRLSMIMLIITAISGGLVSSYASGYMKRFHLKNHDVRDRRKEFFFFLFISLASVMGILVSNNVMIMYMFWELIIIMTYALVAYKGDKSSKTYAFRCLTFNLTGGIFLVAGIIVLGTVFGTVEFDTMILTGSVYGDVVAIPAMFFALAAITMSLQMPFSGWFVKALDMVSPAKAFVSSVLLLNTGLFIIVKLSVVLGTSNFAGITVMIVGGITFFVSSVCALYSKDARKTTALSTIAVSGLALALGGLGTPESIWACIMVIIIHTFAKPLMLLCEGDAYLGIEMHEENDRTIFGKKRKLCICMLTGAAAMMISFFELVLLRANVIASLADSGNIILIAMVVFGCGAIIVFGTKMIGELSFSASYASMSESRSEDDDQKEEKIGASVKILVIISILISIIFPLVSVFAIGPYIEEAFGGASSFFSISDSITGIIMIAFIVLVAGAFYQKKGKVKMPLNYDMSYISEEEEIIQLPGFDERKVFRAGVTASLIMLVTGVGFIIGTLVSLLGGAA